jgi:hypothetical protein
MGNFADKTCAENQNIHFIYNTALFLKKKIVPFMGQFVKITVFLKDHR